MMKIVSLSEFLSIFFPAPCNLLLQHASRSLQESKLQGLETVSLAPPTGQIETCKSWVSDQLWALSHLSQTPPESLASFTQNT